MRRLPAAGLSPPWLAWPHSPAPGGEPREDSTTRPVPAPCPQARTSQWQMSRWLAPWLQLRHLTFPVRACEVIAVPIQSRTLQGVQRPVASELIATRIGGCASEMNDCASPGPLTEPGPANSTETGCIGGLLSVPERVSLSPA